MPINPRWLDLCRQRTPGLPEGLVVVLQHHGVAADTVIVAPLRRPVGEVGILDPLVPLDGVTWSAQLLDMAAVPRSSLRAVVGSALEQQDAITEALAAIFSPTGPRHRAW